jgi:hypothetical protein
VSPPGKTARVQPFEVGVPFHCGGRKQTAGRQLHRGRIVPVRLCGFAKISQLLSTDTLSFPTSQIDSAAHSFPTHFLLV